MGVAAKQRFGLPVEVVERDADKLHLHEPEGRGCLLERQLEQNAGRHHFGPAQSD